MSEVIVLFNGFSSLDTENNVMNANCTCTLIKGPNNVIVDTMTPWDKDKIIDALKGHKIHPDDIHYVVSTHGHSDHIGNNNLFLKAKHIVGFSFSHKETYFLHNFDGGDHYEINSSVEVIPTIGHTMTDVTVLVKNLTGQTIAVVGDLFECKEDINNMNIWKEAGSEAPKEQIKNRYEIAKMADIIIPGHGPQFKVTDEMRTILKSQFNKI